MRGLLRLGGRGPLERGGVEALEPHDRRHPPRARRGRGGCSVRASPTSPACSTCGSQSSSAAGSCTSTPSCGPTGPDAVDRPPPWLTAEVLGGAVRQAVVATVGADRRRRGCALGEPARPRRPRRDRGRRRPGRRLRRQVRDEDDRRGLRARQALPGRRGPGARANDSALPPLGGVRLGARRIARSSRSSGSESTPTRSGSPDSWSPSRGASRPRSARCEPLRAALPRPRSTSRRSSTAATSSPDAATATPEPRRSRSCSPSSMSRCRKERRLRRIDDANLPASRRE